MKSESKKNSGFSLVELIVALAVFTIIMTISMGSILSVFDANKKSKSLQIVMDNLNLATESMTRTIRFATNYHCDITQGSTSTPRDCPSGATSIAVTDSTGRLIVYKLVGSQIFRSINGGVDYAVTSTDIAVTNLSFWVFGSALFNNGADTFQPRAIIVMRGFVGQLNNQRNIQRSSSFSLETTVSQRLFDSQ